MKGKVKVAGNIMLAQKLQTLLKEFDLKKVWQSSQFYVLLTCYCINGSYVTFTVPCLALPYHTIPYHTIPYHTIPYHTIPYHTIPYHTIPCTILLYYISYAVLYYIITLYY
jgi:hypothetical protein